MDESLAAHVPTFVIFLVAVRSLPYSWPGEAAITLLAGACAGGFATVVRFGQGERASTLARNYALMFLGLAGCEGVVVPFLGRETYAAGLLGWSCDGTLRGRIIDANNHCMRSFVIEQADGTTVRFRDVDRELFDETTVGQHLTKRPGSPFVELDGQQRVILRRPDVF